MRLSAMDDILSLDFELMEEGVGVVNWCRADDTEGWVELGAKGEDGKYLLDEKGNVKIERRYGEFTWKYKDELPKWKPGRFNR